MNKLPHCTLLLACLSILLIVAAACYSRGTYSTDGDFSITATPDVMAACGGDALDNQYFDLLDDIVAGDLALETARGEQCMEFVNGVAAVQ